MSFAFITGAIGASSDETTKTTNSTVEETRSTALTVETREGTVAPQLITHSKAVPTTETTTAPIIDPRRMLEREYQAAAQARQQRVVARALSFQESSHAANHRPLVV